MVRTALDVTYRVARRIVVLLLGGTVIVAGLIMLLTPGPATIVIPAGLAILGLEFAWARRWLRAIKAKAQETIDGIRNRRKTGLSDQ